MLQDVSVQHKGFGMTDNEIAKSLRLRALAAAQKRIQGDRMIAEAKDAQERYLASRWLIEDVKYRLGVVRRVDDVLDGYIGDDAVVILREPGVELYTYVIPTAEVHPRQLYAGVRCPLCDERLTTQITYLADIGDLIMQAGQHCDGAGES